MLGTPLPQGPKSKLLGLLSPSNKSVSLWMRRAEAKIAAEIPHRPPRQRKHEWELAGYDGVLWIPHLDPLTWAGISFPAALVLATNRSSRLIPSLENWP